MPRIMILGAGASRACPNTRPDLRMPLLFDIPEIFNAERLAPEAEFLRAFGIHLRGLLDLSGGDIEALFTTMFQLDERFFSSSGTHILEPEFIDRLRTCGALDELFSSPEERGRAQRIVERLRAFSEDDSLKAVFGPGNFLHHFRFAMVQYFDASIQRHPCPFHQRLFERLEMRDVVASFNYDDIADYALHGLGKLTAMSFEHLGFSSVTLPENTPAFGPFVNFLKVHGSVNWFNHYVGDSRIEPRTPRGLRPSIYGGPEVHYRHGRPALPADSGNTYEAFLLPLHCKDLVYRSVPIFTRHMDAFRRALSIASEIWLVGKNFMNTDRELNGLVRWATSDRERVLNVIDPHLDIAFHLRLFNARLGRRYATLEEYASAVPENATRA